MHCAPRGARGRPAAAARMRTSRGAGSGPRVSATLRKRAGGPAHVAHHVAGGQEGAEEQARVCVGLLGALAAHKVQVRAQVQQRLANKHSRVTQLGLRLGQTRTCVLAPSAATGVAAGAQAVEGAMLMAGALRWPHALVTRPHMEGSAGRRPHDRRHHDRPALAFRALCLLIHLSPRRQAVAPRGLLLAEPVMSCITCKAGLQTLLRHECCKSGTVGGCARPRRSRV